MLGEEGTYDHSTTVVHVSAVIELAHCSVNDWVTCFSFCPGFEMLLVIFPGDIGIFGLEWLIHASHVSEKKCDDRWKYLPDIWPVS